MKESVQIIRFMIVGTSNAVIAAGVIWLMMEVCGCDYRLSNIVGYIASLINNGLWSCLSDAVPLLVRHGRALGTA